MPFISFSERDLLRGKVIQPAWYRVHIESIGEKSSADGGSINYPVEGTVMFNADNGDKTFTGVPIEWNFNSKAPGFAKGFFESLGLTPEVGKRYDFNWCAGKELDVFIENDTWQSRIVNRVNHKYRAPREVTV